MFCNRRKSKRCKVCSTDLITQHAENGVATETIIRNMQASDIVFTGDQHTYGTLAANAESGDYTIPISNPGYTPLAVMRIDVYGTGSKSINVFRATVNSAKTGVYCRFANLSDTATGELRLAPRIMWIKS